MEYEQVDYRVWKYVADGDMRMQMMEDNRRMELGWVEHDEGSEDSFDIMDDYEGSLEEDGMDGFEAGFLQGYSEAAVI